MHVILKQGGIGRGGLNFDAHVKRGSTDLADLFFAHIGAMDAFARGLKVAARLIKDGVLDGARKRRYSSYDSGVGVAIENGQTSLRELESFILKKGEPRQTSGRQELLENIINQYLFKV
jgi:xylose isomerase